MTGTASLRSIGDVETTGEAAVREAIETLFDATSSPAIKDPEFRAMIAIQAILEYLPPDQARVSYRTAAQRVLAGLAEKMGLIGATNKVRRRA